MNLSIFRWRNTDLKKFTYPWYTTPSAVVLSAIPSTLVPPRGFLRWVAWANCGSHSPQSLLGAVLYCWIILRSRCTPLPTPTTELRYRQLTTQAQSSYQSTNFQLVLSTRNNSNTWGKKAKPQPERKDILLYLVYPLLQSVTPYTHLGQSAAKVHWFLAHLPGMFIRDSAIKNPTHQLLHILPPLLHQGFQEVERSSFS